MAPKEPTRHQLSSRLTYNQGTPAFLQKLKNRIAGISDDEDENEDDEYEYVGGGRPPIPKRPAIPERPADDPGSANEDADDELPQVVVLREGKHLSKREVENEKRKAQGLPPLPDPQELLSKPETTAEPVQQPEKSEKKEQHGLSFSSGSGSKKASGKRKAVGQPDDEESGGPESKGRKESKKKGKKAPKTLLSFQDDA